MSKFNVIVFAAAAAGGASAAILPIKVVVQLQEAPKAAPAPFADVGGFTVRRNEMEFKAVSCPDASNDNGELTCRLSCGTDDADMRLQLFSPLKDRARQVAGLSPPGAFAVDVVSCRVTSRLPVVVVYKTPLVVAAELLASQPAVFNAAASLSPAGLRFKPFDASAARLQALAADPGRRAAVAQLADLAALQQEAQEVGRGAAAASRPDAAPYVAGAKSIALRASAIAAMGSAGAALVPVSSDEAQLHQSVARVERVLGGGSALTPEATRLRSDLSALKRRGMPAPHVVPVLPGRSGPSDAPGTWGGSGTSGTSGTSGASGYSGTRGALGAQEASGALPMPGRGGTRITIDHDRGAATDAGGHPAATPADKYKPVRRPNLEREGGGR